MTKPQMPYLKRGRIARLFTENFLSQKTTYGVAVLAMVALALSATSTAYLMQLIFDTLSRATGALPATLVAALVLLTFILRGAAGYVQVVAMARAGNRIVADIQRRLYSKLLKQDARYFERTESSDILMRVTQSAHSARQIIDVVISSFVRDLLTLIGLVSVMIYQSPVLSVIFLFIGPIAMLGVRHVLARVRSIMSAEMQSLAEIFKALQETAVGRRVIKTFNLEPQMESRMSQAVKDVEKRSNAVTKLEASTTPLMDTLAGVAIATIVVVGSAPALLGQQPTAGQLMSFVTALLMAYEPAKRLSRMRVQIEAASVGVDLMYGILDIEDAMLDHPDAVTLPDGVGSIKLRNVTFSYDGHRNVLTSLSVDFLPGKMNVLIGPSGSGKSTIVSLLLRLFDPDVGAVELDGVDVRTVKGASLRRELAYVGQETFLFSGTVRENIIVGRTDTTEEALVSAAKAARADEFIGKLPMGYETHIGENGILLSGGQRQRLSLARALVRSPRVIILDEPTSALDGTTVELLMVDIRERLAGRTIVIVTHDPRVISYADLVVDLASR